jgi:steroid 5-alpha reductase family enzyme
MNSSKLNLILNAVRIALVVIGVGLSLLLINGPNVNAGTEAVEAFRDGGQMSAAIMFTIVLMVAVIAVIFIFFFLQLATNTKKTVMSILGLIAALVIYLIFFAAGTSDTTDTLLLKNPVEQGTVVTTTAGIYTVMVGLFAGVLVILLGPLMGRFRK